MISDGHGQVAALITENLRRRRLDQTDPIGGDPFTDPDAAKRWVDRLEVESGLVAELLREEQVSTDAVALLVAFASTAIEMWAMYAGRDALTLVENIAVRWERDDPQ